jgi:hypothetical protein
VGNIYTRLEKVSDTAGRPVIFTAAGYANARKRLLGARRLWRDRRPEQLNDIRALIFKDSTGGRGVLVRIVQWPREKSSQLEPHHHVGGRQARHEQMAGSGSLRSTTPAVRMRRGVLRQRAHGMRTATNTRRALKQRAVRRPPRGRACGVSPVRPPHDAPLVRHDAGK